MMKDKVEIIKLLKDYENIIEKLHKLKFSDTSKIVAEVGENAAHNILKADRKSGKGYDLIKNNKKYEVKSRKDTSWNPKSNKSFRPISLIQKETANFFVFIIFTDEWKIKHFLKIPAPELIKIIGKKESFSLNKKLIEDYDKLNCHLKIEEYMK